MSDHTGTDKAPGGTGVVLAASFSTPDPGLTGRCLAALQVFVARAGGGSIDGITSGTEQGVFARFDDNVRAVRCAVRASVEMRKLSSRHGDADLFGLRIGLATGPVGHVDAARLRDAAAAGEILAAPDIVPGLEGRVDVETVDISGRRDADGQTISAFALTPTLTGTVFRYMPWTSPRKRRIGLIVAAGLIVVAALGLLFE